MREDVPTPSSDTMDSVVGTLQIDNQWTLPDFWSALPGLVETSLSFLFFRLVLQIADYWVRKNASTTFLASEKLRWKWKNIFVSFIHANITGIFSVLCFYWTPKLAEDMISTHTPLSHGVVVFAMGYFIHDTVDMSKMLRSRQNMELIVHHFVILIALSIPVFIYKSVGYMVVALLVEVNSVFLHFRQLLLLHKVEKTSSIYRMNSIVNLGTFIIFRIFPLCWMTRWIVINKSNVPFFFYSLASTGLAITTVMNIVLFYRCLNSDFIRCKDTSGKVE